MEEIAIEILQKKKREIDKNTVETTIKNLN